MSGTPAGPGCGEDASGRQGERFTGAGLERRCDVCLPPEMAPECIRNASEMDTIVIVSKQLAEDFSCGAVGRGA